MRHSRSRKRWRDALRRRGAAALDYVLVICVVLPMVGFILLAGPRIMRLAYEMVSALVAWPFM